MIDYADRFQICNNGQPCGKAVSVSITRPPPRPSPQLQGGKQLSRVEELIMVYIVIIRTRCDRLAYAMGP
jgi:hypothetical protein